MANGGVVQKRHVLVFWWHHSGYLTTLQNIHKKYKKSYFGIGLSDAYAFVTNAHLFLHCLVVISLWNMHFHVFGETFVVY